MDNPGNALIEHFAALHEDDLDVGDDIYLWDAASITWLDHVAARSLEADLADVAVERAPASITEITEITYAADLDAAPLAGLGSLGDWLVLLEPNGFWGADRDRLRRWTAAGGRAVNVFTSVSAESQLAVAAGGEILAAVNPDMIDTDGVQGPEPARIEQPGAGLPWDEEPLASAFTVASLVTGTRLDADWLTTPQRQVQLPG